jgi:DNA invertase Pin-like site-specific DNA recombinase
MTGRALHRKQRRTLDRKAAPARLLTDRRAPPASPTARNFGYARVSTVDQNLDVQLAALRGNGVADADLYVEKVSALNAKRPLFNLLLKMMEAGDTLLIHSLSRLGRDVKQIYSILDEIAGLGVTWRSLTEAHLDATTASGRLMLNVTGAMAQFERDQIIERTRRGMQECRRKGMWLGRKPIVSEADVRQMLSMRRRRVAVESIARRYKVKPSTVYARTNALMRSAKRARYEE